MTAPGVESVAWSVIDVRLQAARTVKIEEVAWHCANRAQNGLYPTHLRMTTRARASGFLLFGLAQGCRQRRYRLGFRPYSRGQKTMFASVSYRTSKGSTSPEGNSSFSQREFQGRFQDWSPNWDKPVELAHERIAHDTLPLGMAVYESGTPEGRYTNGESVLLFEGRDSFILVRSDFFTRLLFTEAEYMARPVSIGGAESITVEEAIRDRRSPAAPFWAAAGLPGIPLAIGVNASLRSADGNTELLAHKVNKAQGGMADTVGPPVSAGSLPKLETLNPDGLTLGMLVDECMRAAAEQELKGLSLPDFTRNAAWLDGGRGFKPEVNFRATFPMEALSEFQGAVCENHAGCVTLQGHLDAATKLTAEGKQTLEGWGLNFQAWFLW